MDVALLVPGGHVRELLEQELSLEKQVVEVHRRALGEELLVPLVRSMDDLVEIVRLPQAERLGVDQLALGAGDRGQDGPWRELLRVDVHLAHAALDERHLVRVVVDDEVAVEPYALALTPQHLRAERMERPDGHVLHAGTQERVQPLAHLAGGFVREGDGGDPVRRHAADPHQVGDAVGDHARLATARARYDEERPVDRLDRFALVGVQPFEDVRCHGVLCSDYSTA